MWGMEAHECPATSKTCTGCGEAKPLSGFTFDKWRGRYFAACKECTNAKQRERYLKNREAKLRQCAEYREANKENVKASLADWYQRNKDHVLERSKKYRSSDRVKAMERERQKLRYESNRAAIQLQRKEYYAANKEAQEKRRQYLGEHYRNNKPAYYARRMKRIAAEKQAIPKWASLAAIVEIYETAIAKTEETGTPHEVDHIIPLQGRLVCGLHVEYNLRVVPRHENRSKSNNWLKI